MNLPDKGSPLKHPGTYLIFALSWAFVFSGAYLNSHIQGARPTTMAIPFAIGAIFASLLAYLNYAVEKKKQSEKHLLMQVIESLAMALDERDQYTHGHARRVTCLALILQEKLGGGKSDAEVLRLSAILHDIGKVGIPDSVLLKPGKLDKEEFDLIKKHPAQGCHILQPLGSDQRIHEVMTTIRHHHERFDGNGYPDRLSGEDIPLSSRIIAIADSFDAMTSNRPYREAMELSQALEQIRAGRGTQFDPKLCDIFLQLHAEAPDTCCPNIDCCPIFALIENHAVIKAYKSQYCRFFFASCARFKMRKKRATPDSLLPDGSFLPSSS
ncbi:MAG: HD-GYP domain-containing protein [Thermodesulfobacteriota bacterium]